MVKFRVHRCATSKALINLFILCPLCSTRSTLTLSTWLYFVWLYSVFAMGAFLTHFVLLCLPVYVCILMFIAGN